MGLFRRWAFNLLFFSAVAVYLAGLAVDVMEIDAAQYASLSREMAETDSYLEIHHRGKDYLDKPPLLFWLSSGFIKIFGPYNWTYKLASFLFSILGIVSTYKLGHLLYNKRIGFIAAIMLATSQAYFLFNQDVKTDTILTGAVIFSVWQLMAYVFYHNRWHLIGGFVGIGLGMLAKGPIAIMVPVLALSSYFIGRKRYKEFFRKDWLWGILIVMVMLSPMVYGLYQQYDMHPEKEVPYLSRPGEAPKTDVSGVKFYFWTQSFGRITGESTWENASPPTFFVSTFLWSFLPWSLLAIWAILWRTSNTFVDVVKRRKKQEWLTLGGFLLPFLAFSASRFKLDHYIFVLFPFASIITAEFVLRVLFEKPRWWGRILIGIQTIIPIAVTTICLYILLVIFPTTNFLVWIVFIGLMLCAIISFFSKSRLNQVVLSSALAIIAGNWVLNTHFYPELFQYQPSHQMAEFIEQENIPKDRIFISDSHGFYSFEFYANHTFYDLYSEPFKEKWYAGEDVWVYASEKQTKKLAEHFPNIQVITSFPAYHISTLSFDFLNPATRDELLENQFLIKLSK